MGCLHAEFDSNRMFLRAMEDELTRSISGGPGREDCQDLEMEVYDNMIEELQAASERLGTPIPSGMLNRQAFRKRLDNNVVGAAQAGVWNGFSFKVEPAFDDDDCAEYCLDPKGKKSFKAHFMRWLAHRHSVLRLPVARAALLKAFDPLAFASAAIAIPRNERQASEVEQLGRALQRELGEHLDAFQPFFKRYHDRESGGRTYLDDMDNREAGRITSDFELPITGFLKKRLRARARELAGRSLGDTPKVPGPFQVEGYAGDVLLVKDAAAWLDISPSQVRRRLETNDLKGWKPSEFRELLNMRPNEDLLLHSIHGDIVVKKYTIVDAESVRELRARRGEDGTYNIHKRGRPRKPTGGSHGSG